MPGTPEPSSVTRVLRERATAAPVSIREPDTPASEKQRQCMEHLLTELGWTNERLAAFAAERMVNLLTLTKREAANGSSARVWSSRAPARPRRPAGYR